MNESTIEKIVLVLDTLDRKVSSLSTEIKSLMDFVLSRGIELEEEREKGKSKSVLDEVDSSSSSTGSEIDDGPGKNDDDCPIDELLLPPSAFPLQPKSFGSYSNFDPFAEETKPTIDYSARPIKNTNDYSPGVHVVYIYETANDAEIDAEDLSNILKEIDSDDEKEKFEKALQDIAYGVTQINATRDHGLHIQTLRVRDFLIEIRYNKVSDANIGTGSFSKLFM